MSTYLKFTEIKPQIFIGSAMQGIITNMNMCDEPVKFTKLVTAIKSEFVRTSNARNQCKHS